MTPTKTSMHRFDPQTGKQTEMALLYEPERFHARQLSAFDWSYEGWSAPEAIHSVYHGFRPEAVVQRMLDLYADRVDRGPLPTEEMSASLATHSWEGLKTISEYVYPRRRRPTFIAHLRTGRGRARWSLRSRG